MELEGNFVANVPQQIQADWNPKYACLAGFPLNILYTRLRLPVAVTVCYWFDPGTFHEDEATKQMDYFGRQKSEYYVRVIYHKRTGVWETFKYRGEALVRNASGPQFDAAMIHTTMGGPEPDELLPRGIKSQ